MHRAILLLLLLAPLAFAGDGAPVNGLLLTAKAPERVAVGAKWTLSARFEATAPLTYHVARFAGRGVHFPQWTIVSESGERFAPYRPPFSYKLMPGMDGTLKTLEQDQVATHDATFTRVIRLDGKNRWSLSWRLLPPGKYRVRCRYSRTARQLAGSRVPDVKGAWQGAATSDEHVVEVVAPTRPYLLLELPERFVKTGKKLPMRLRVCNPTAAPVTLRGEVLVTMTDWGKMTTGRVGLLRKTLPGGAITLKAGETRRVELDWYAGFALKGEKLPLSIFDFVPKRPRWYAKLSVSLGELKGLDDGQVRDVDSRPK